MNLPVFLALCLRRKVLLRLRLNIWVIQDSDMKTPQGDVRHFAHSRIQISRKRTADRRRKTSTTMKCENSVKTPQPIFQKTIQERIGGSNLNSFGLR